MPQVCNHCSYQVHPQEVNKNQLKTGEEKVQQEQSANRRTVEYSTVSYPGFSIKSDCLPSLTWTVGTVLRCHTEIMRIDVMMVWIVWGQKGVADWCESRNFISGSWMQIHRRLRSPTTLITQLSTWALYHYIILSWWHNRFCLIWEFAWGASRGVYLVVLWLFDLKSENGNQLVMSTLQY